MGDPLQCVDHRAASPSVVRSMRLMPALQLPVGLPGSGPASEQVLVAYDGMRLPLSLLTAAPKVMGPLVLAFTKEDEQ